MRRQTGFYDGEQMAVVRSSPLTTAVTSYLWSPDRCVLDFANDVLDIYDSEQAPQPLLSYALDGASLTGRLVPRAMKAIGARDHTKHKGSVFRPARKREHGSEHSAKSLAETIVPQDKLVLNLTNAVLLNAGDGDPQVTTCFVVQFSC